jgi:hypothetical protein
LPPRPTTAPATRRAYTPSNSHRFVDPKSPEKQPSSARNNKRSKPAAPRVQHESAFPKSRTELRATTAVAPTRPGQ